MIDTSKFATNFPKLESPFKREKIDGKFVCIPEITNKYRWFIEEGTIAVDKIEGTGTSVCILNGSVYKIINRSHGVDIYNKNNMRFYEGVVNAIDKGYFIPSFDGQFFGELIGPKIRKNRYNLKESIWIPFQHLIEKYRLDYWSEIITQCENKSDEEIFNIISDFFKGLWSLFKTKRGEKGVVDETTPFEDNYVAEGLVFYNQDGEMCKLRRDMFDWYTGKVYRKEGM